ncbi:hypothetical protein SKAU_G00071390 [Synaphobranchus kaupii]|uniref:Uncharacterized protein n=1 Tax=Synaphobranchus kaupii TaxID=118154 RepID=A0A9Q1J9J9_SYNKA|nr:hypothetical protein SKAU_G00071390 [Synaphobranchus kaupii]
MNPEALTLTDIKKKRNGGRVIAGHQWLFATSLSHCQLLPCFFIHNSRGAGNKSRSGLSPRVSPRRIIGRGSGPGRRAAMALYAPPATCERKPAAEATECRSGGASRREETAASC